MRWITALVLLLITSAAQAVNYPSSLYTFTLTKHCVAGTVNQWGVCTNNSECGAGGVCLESYIPEDFDALAAEMHAVEAFLGTNGSQLVLRSNFNLASEVRALLDAGEYTGSGDLVFGVNPFVDQFEPRIYHIGGSPALPTAGTATGAWYYVDNSNGSSCTATGSTRVICVDLGAGNGYGIVAGGGGGGSITLRNTGVDVPGAPHTIYDFRAPLTATNQGGGVAYLGLNKTGTGTVAAVATSTPPNGCAQWLSGNLASTGAACGTGGGGGLLVDDGDRARITKPAAVSGIAPSAYGADEANFEVLTQNDSWRTMFINRVNQLVQPLFKHLLRNLVVRTGELYVIYPPNGFAYEVTAGGTTAGTQPLGLPIVRHTQMALSQNQYVLPGYGGGEQSGFWYKVTSANCTTGRKQTLSWCGTPSCTVTDGDCTLTRETMPGTVTFSDGTASFSESATNGDAYGGWPVTWLGSGRSLDPAFFTFGGDNIVAKFAITYPNVMGQGFDRSMIEGGYAEVIMGGGDPRSGTPETEFWNGWNPRKLKVDGYARMYPPTIAPTLTLASGGSLNVGIAKCFSIAWEDRTIGLPTATSPWKACITPTSGNQKIVITLPEDGDWTWPTPGGGSSSAQTRAIVMGGSRDGYCNYLDVLEDADDSVTLSSEDEFRETDTCEIFNRNQTPVLQVNDSNSVRQGVWQANATGIITNISIMRPTVENGYQYLAQRICNAGTNCRGSTCTRGATTGTTGSSEPNWDSYLNTDLIPDGNVCWRRLAMDVPGIMAQEAVTILDKNLDTNGVRPLGRWTGTALEWFTPGVANPFASPDLKLYRSAANTLTLDGGNLVVNGTLTVNSCTGCGGAGSGDSIKVNGVDATDANLLSTSTIAVTLNTTPTPDEISFTLLDASVTPAKLDTAGDNPADEECLTYEASNSKFEWQSCGSGGITGNGANYQIPVYSGATTVVGSNYLSAQTQAVTAGVLQIGAISSSATNAGQLNLWRQHAGYPQNGDYIGTVSFGGSGIATLTPLGAFIRTLATENWSSGASGGVVSIWATQAGTNAPTSGLDIGSVWAKLTSTSGEWQIGSGWKLTRGTISGNRPTRANFTNSDNRTYAIGAMSWTGGSANSEFTGSTKYLPACLVSGFSDTWFAWCPLPPSSTVYGFNCMLRNPLSSGSYTAAAYQGSGDATLIGSCTLDSTHRDCSWFGPWVSGTGNDLAVDYKVTANSPNPSTGGYVTCEMTWLPETW